MDEHRNEDVVILTMTGDEYRTLLIALGYATMTALQSGDRIMVKHYFELMNSLNKGNSAYKPYGAPKA